MPDATNPPASPELSKGWTIETYAAHNEALRAADIRFQEERDRRYTELDVEREKALKIKEGAEQAALGLAREIQTYKDEKANELREQIASERGLYVTKPELTGAVEKIEEIIKPLSAYVQSQQGRREGGLDSRGLVTVVISLAGFVLAAVIFLTR